MFKIRPVALRAVIVPAFFFTLSLLLPSCLNRRVKKNEMLEAPFEMPSDFQTNFTQPEYKPVLPKVMRLIHTSLKVEPIFQNSTLRGEARINMVPHFYQTDSISLDAQCFEIEELKVMKGTSTLPSKYTYNGKKIQIKLEREISRRDTVVCYIKYIARPEECETESSGAIVSDKGLFFINPDGSEPYKPRQVWTQGETSYNSRWFPTIESPEQKMTQEIAITIENGMVTLSNGLLVSSVSASADKHTDTWVQSKPASPYLTMIAAGKFEIIKDKWRDMEVSYYLEPEYARYAKKIFGETPAMIEFFSRKLGVDYPWEKYSQIVVRDYVSGAMENTTATVMGENLQRTDRELLDETGEDIISHELFHHWFGDLVTCESWSNLPLNESFATYAEYLWLEHKYGKDDAEQHRLGDLNTYLNEAGQKMVGLFRPYYEKEEEMFDAHSYQKGGLVLHYLRKLTGDEAFFEILKRYLSRHAFSSAEIPHLRQMTEEVTGIDYNWFFDQWFYLSGHPVLDIKQEWKDSTRTVELTIKQLQEFGDAPVFRLPMDVHIWNGQEKKVQRIILSQSEQTFTFNCKEKPTLVTVDPERWVPGQRTLERTGKEWVAQYQLENTFASKKEALDFLSFLPVQEEERDLVLKTFADPSAGIRLAGINYYASFMENHKNAYKNQLIQLATKDEKSQVKAEALGLLNKFFSSESWMIKLNTDATYDRSYLVASKALLNLSASDATLAFEMAKRTEADSNILIIKSIATIYALNGSDSENGFFMKSIQRITGFDNYDIISLYGNFLLGRSDSVIHKGVDMLLGVARKNPIWFIRLAAVNAITEIEQMYLNRAREFKLQATTSRSGDNSLEQKAGKAEKMAADIHSSLQEIKASESDINLRNIFKE